MNFECIPDLFLVPGVYTESPPPAPPPSPKVVAALLLGLLSLPGCLAAQLRVPTHEHYVQLATLCRMGRDEADPGYASDVCHAARQACYLAAAVRSEDGAACDEVMR